MSYRAKIEIVSDCEELAVRSVRLFVSEMKKAVQSRNSFNVALSGGRTPRRFFELLGELPESQSLEWNKIHLFWVDERYVPSDSQWSNYKLVVDTFLNKVSIPQKNVHRIPTEGSDFKLSAQEYENSIREVFGLKKGQVPEFDMIFLGMGIEGHTGSLFPNSYATFDTEDLACVVYVLDEKLNRITLTYPVLRAAAHVVVQISGGEKADILKKVMTGEIDEVKYPIHVLWPVLDKVTWLVDKEAAQLL